MLVLNNLLTKSLQKTKKRGGINKCTDYGSWWKWNLSEK